MSTTMSTTTPLPWAGPPRAALPAALRLGPVRLAVTDLDRSVAYYTHVLGVAETARETENGRAVARLGATGTAGGAGGEDVVVLQQEPGARRAGRHAGLYHVAYNVASRLDLARALRRIAERGTPLEGATDHGTHEALYLSDPDGNGLELAWDRPRERWPRTLDEAIGGMRPLDLKGLLALTAGEPLAQARPVARAEPGGRAGHVRAGHVRVGHVHLHVGDVGRAVDFYVGLVGFELQADIGAAAFMSAGGYHHHLGANVWRGQDAPPPPADAVGLSEWQLSLPTAADVEAVRARLAAGGAPITPAGEAGGSGVTPSFTTADPWGIPLRVAVDPRTA